MCRCRKETVVCEICVGYIVYLCNYILFHITTLSYFFSFLFPRIFSIYLFPIFWWGYVSVLMSTCVHEGKNRFNDKNNDKNL